MANLYVEFDEISKAIVLYNQSISLSIPETENNNYNIKIFSSYNLGLIYYTTDQYFLAKKNLEIALETNKKKNKDIDNEISAVIYETLGEVELEYRKYGEALNYLSKALDIRKKLNNLDDKFALKRISFFITFIYDQYNYEEVNSNLNNNTNSIFNNDRFKNRPSSLSQNILGNTAKSNFSNNNNNYNAIPALNNFDNPSLLLNSNNPSIVNLTQTNKNYSTKNIETDKESRFKEPESNINNYNNKNNSDEEDNNFDYNFTNFFKSNMQNLTETYKNLNLKVKPKEQDKSESNTINPSQQINLRDDEIEEVEKFFLFMTKLNQKEIEILNQNQKYTEINLPINFSDKFKACLSYSQKIQLLEMKILKLRRNVILKNPLGKIEIENLNFEILQRKNNSAKKIDNVLNRYANNYNLEKWVENNIGINNNTYNNIYGNYNESLKKNTVRSANSNNENYNNQLGKDDSIGQNNKLNSNFQVDKIIHEFGLNNRQVIIFNDMKNALEICVKKNSDKNYEMLSDEEIANVIKHAEDEEEIKFYIKNPEIIFSILNNNDGNNIEGDS